MLNRQDRRYGSQEHESGARPTLRGCREKPLHKRSRFERSLIRTLSKTLKSTLDEPLFRGACRRQKWDLAGGHLGEYPKSNRNKRLAPRFWANRPKTLGWIAL